MKTAEAMDFAGLNRSDWENCLQRGLLPNAPKTEMGYVRLFDVDELIAAYVLGQLFERKVVVGFACQIAVDVLDLVRKSPAVKTLSAWKIAKPGNPAVVVAGRKPHREAIELFKFQIAYIRAAAIEGIRALRSPPPP